LWRVVAGALGFEVVAVVLVVLEPVQDCLSPQEQITP
jgi:hypothetical protein